MRRSILLIAALSVVFADLAYPNNPECGWGYETYRAVGDWATDAGAAANWNPAEPLGIMTPTHAQPCEYKATVHGLKPGKSYQWKVTISGEKTGFAVQWGCSGYQNPPACTFTADSTGGITFVIVASYAYPLTTEPADNSGSSSGSSGSSGSSSGGSTGGGGSSSGGGGDLPPPPPPSGGSKKVFAHYMMGYASKSDKSFFEGTIAQAQSAGIDAFAANLGQDGWENDKLQQLLDAAHSRNFSIFISFDMNEFHDNFGLMTQYVQKYTDHPAYFHHEGKAFVSTFSGGGLGESRWADWKKNSGKNLYFCPFFDGDLANNYNQFPSSDCQFSWDAWGAQNSNNRDVAAVKAGHSQGKTYMAGVAPWFYCHLPQWGKNWVWPPGVTGAENLWPLRWRQAIASGADFVEIVTWNDYSESSYIAPLSQEIPDFANNYVQGMDHTAWLKMARFYVPYFKTGSAPQIAENQVYWWYRIHLKDANRNDPAGKPNMNYNVQDCVEVFTISGSFNGTVKVTIGGRETSWKITEQEQEKCVPYGGTGAVSIQVEANGQTYKGNDGPAIQGDGSIYNFNAWVGSFDYPL